MPIYIHGYIQTVRTTQAQLQISSSSNSFNISDEISEEIPHN
ncbi:28343_t:CDS:1, partial [Dentiscutata erythropus]